MIRVGVLLKISNVVLQVHLAGIKVCLERLKTEKRCNIRVSHFKYVHVIITY
jgi:hypothetical protein